MNYAAPSIIKTQLSTAKKLGGWATLWLALVAVVSFHSAYLIKNAQILLVVFFYCLFRLTGVRSTRQAFYLGMAMGMAIYAPQLSFFWNIFQGAAIPLWLILSLWLGFFLLLGRICLERLGLVASACLAPFLWIGVEYFRSELYYLRFSWINAGYAFSNSDALPYLACYGVYGIGFLLITLGVSLAIIRRLNWTGRIAFGTCLTLVLFYPFLAPVPQNSAPVSFRVTGAQLEFPSPAEAIAALDRSIQNFPDTDLLVLSEYSFVGPVPELVKKWCRRHRKYLVVGAEDPVSASQYYNVAAVIDPEGKLVFQQAKCIPVQFMKDGLPAGKQELWNSPWGKLGFGICYDASYTRVTDELVRQGAQGLIFPTMDVAEWGPYQHQLHARIAPMRAAEYELPVFRLCSSGVSQFVDSHGRVLESAPFPGEGAIISAPMRLSAHGRIPPDRWLAHLSVGVTIALIAWLAGDAFLRRKKPAVISAT